jgi:hypothetical protein
MNLTLPNFKYICKPVRLILVRRGGLQMEGRSSIPGGGKRRFLLSTASENHPASYPMDNARLHLHSAKRLLGLVLI